MSLSTRQLEVIHAVISAGSVTEAASALGISQPAVSMILRDCREIVGFPLFVRRQGRLQPTTETYVLLPELERVFEGMRHVQRLLSDLKDQTAGFVNIGSVPVVTDALMPQMLKQFQASHPKVLINLYGMMHAEVVEHIETGKLDFGLVITSHPGQGPNMIDLVRTPLVLVAHETHPLAKNDLVRPEDLVDSQLISFTRSLPLGAMIATALQGMEIRARAAVELTHASTALLMAQQQIGVALVPEIALRRANMEGLVRRPFVPKTDLIVQLLLPHTRALSRSARLALAALRKVAADTAGEHEEPALQAHDFAPQL